MSVHGRRDRSGESRGQQAACRTRHAVGVTTASSAAPVLVQADDCDRCPRPSVPEARVEDARDREHDNRRAGCCISTERLCWRGPRRRPPADVDATECPIWRLEAGPNAECYFLMRRSAWSARHAGHFTLRQSAVRRPGRYSDVRRFTTTPSMLSWSQPVNTSSSSALGNTCTAVRHRRTAAPGSRAPTAGTPGRRPSRLRPSSATRSSWRPPVWTSSGQPPRSDCMTAARSGHMSKGNEMTNLQRARQRSGGSTGRCGFRQGETLRHTLRRSSTNSALTAGRSRASCGSRSGGRTATE